MKYIKLARSDGGYAAWSPILPGCCDQGKTEEEALGNMKEAIGNKSALISDRESSAGKCEELPG